MTPTGTRAEVLAFPAVYYYTPAGFVVHEDSTATEVSDLNGKVVGTGKDTTFEQYLEKDLSMDAEGAPPFEYLVDVGEIRSYDNSVTAMEDLRLGDGVRLDGVISSLPTIMGAIESGRPLKIIGDPVFYEPLALAIDRGDPEFNDKLKQIVDEMHADGTLTALSEKWYGVDYSSVK